jgi:2-amino-4-hydroxy-6-hydroxymethyldihydropteridine diphosphokinase
MEAGLSLGSNQGDRAEHLRNAVRRLAGLPGVRVLGKSRFYETDPVDVPEAFRELLFLNAVVVVEWPGTVRELWAATKALESAAGRVRGVPNGPRTLDVDILYAGAEVIREPRLTVPHPRWRERRFVTEPLAELRPELILPDGPDRVRDVLAALPTGGVRVFPESW